MVDAEFRLVKKFKFTTILFAHYFKDVYKDSNAGTEFVK